MTNLTTRKQRLKAGLCVLCGELPHREGKQACQKCATKQKIYQFNRRARLKEKNICFNCGQEIKNGKDAASSTRVS